MIYIFYISFFLKYNTVDEKVKKGDDQRGNNFSKRRKMQSIYLKKFWKIMMPVND